MNASGSVDLLTLPSNGIIPPSTRAHTTESAPLQARSRPRYDDRAATVR